MKQSDVAAAVVYLNAPHQLEIRTEHLDLTALEPSEIYCETIVTAVSPGTEIAAYTGQAALKSGVAYPRVQGYCSVGRVCKIGTAVKDVLVGDRVLSFTSHRSHFVMAATDVLVVLREQDSANRIVCSYLYHLGYNAILRSDVRAGTRVLVVGLGVLGLTSIAMASKSGARVFGVSDHAIPKSIALQWGAAAIFARSQLPSLRAALSENLADVVVVTTNSWSDWALALDMAGMRGTIACLGFPGRSECPGAFNPLDSRFFYAKQLRIEAVGISPERPDSRGFIKHDERANLQYISSLIASGRLDPEPLISGVYPGREIETAYRDLISRKNSALTYLLQWH